MTEWLSAHLPFKGGVYTAICDEIIRDVVSPLVFVYRSNEMASCAFFVRYSEGGPHVRLRLQPAEDRWRQYLVDAVKEKWASYRACQPARSVKGSDVAWVDYNPEVDRYGGSAAIAVAEKLFEASSRLALATVTLDVSSDRASRLGRSTLATLTAIHTFMSDRQAATQFAKGYALSYLTAQLPKADERDALIRSFDMTLESEQVPMREYLEYAWQQLSLGHSLTPPLDRYRDALLQYCASVQLMVVAGLVAVRGESLRTWDAAVRYLAPSMIHMTNNRLGVSIAEESYVTTGIHRALNVA
jgi:thiopeptide-type bacteriocin biosynthesis protein